MSLSEFQKITEETTEVEPEQGYDFVVSFYDEEQEKFIKKFYKKRKGKNDKS